MDGNLKITNRSTPEELDVLVLEKGRLLLNAIHTAELSRGASVSWLDQLLQQFMGDDVFRVNALRFIDVLPTLKNDQELVAHLQEYFPAQNFPLPGMAKWGLKLGSGKLGAPLIAGAVRKSVEMMGKRFLGGSSAKEVLKTVTGLRQRGLCCSLDLLGEESVSEAEADEYLQRYLDLLDNLVPELAVWEHKDILDSVSGRTAPRLNLSVKLSSLYSQITPRDFEGGVEAINVRLRPLLLKAREKGVFITVDMEHYDFKDVILGAFKKILMEEAFQDWADIGIALQAYLKDTEQDLTQLADWAKERGTPVTVRLVRGAYWDQECIVAGREEWPVPVWQHKAQTDTNYERCLNLLMSNHPHLEAAVATHNVRSMAVAMVMAEQHGIEPGQFEFQVLYGMGQDLADAIAAMGHRMRVYTPFGELLPGMAYLVRRLLENSSSQSFSRMMDTEQETGDELLSPPLVVENVGDEPVAMDFCSEPVYRFVDPAERQNFAKAIEQARSDLGRTYPLIIGGEERETGEVITSLNPAHPDEVVGQVASAGEAEAEAAQNAAELAFQSWSVLPATERAGYLRKAAEALRQQRNYFAAIEVFEAGKPWAEADGDITEAIDFLGYYAQEAERLASLSHFDLPGELNSMFYRPRGVGVIIPPWNFPLAILVGMLSAAIVTGNTVIVKPSSQTPVVAALFVQLLHKLGLPAGVVNFLPGPGRAVGEYLVQHPRIHFIAFTGSQDVGMRIAQLAAQLVPGQQHVKHVIAEMGGKNAIIVDQDADPDDAVRGVLASAFGFSGQKCSACSRVILVGKENESFIERLVTAARSLRVGLPEEPGTFMGPVIEAAARERMQQMIAQGKKDAKLALEIDCAHLGDGYFIGPTIFTGVSPDSLLATEEIFGPVLAVMNAPNFEQALIVANATRYALTGGVYSRSPKHLEHAKNRFQVGNLYLNRKITGARVGHQPFGGFKLSGMGTKAGGPDYLHQFLEPRTVTENTLRKGYAPES